MYKADLKNHYGSFVNAARALGVTKAAVSNWKDPIPEYIAYKFQVISRGRLRVDPTLYAKSDSAA